MRDKALNAQFKVAAMAETTMWWWVDKEPGFDTLLSWDELMDCRCVDRSRCLGWMANRGAREGEECPSHISLSHTGSGLQEVKEKGNQYNFMSPLYTVWYTWYMMIDHNMYIICTQMFMFIHPSVCLLGEVYTGLLIPADHPCTSALLINSHMSRSIHTITHHLMQPHIHANY